jgi:hypothetical protein
MSTTVQVEACVNGTITRASARAINRATGSSLSGTSHWVAAINACAEAGVTYRVVAAASLAGPDKARHTREVTRSRQAQARREARQDAMYLGVAV